jgi:putative ABC transport system permease protein
MEQLLRNARYAGRMLAKNPGFTTAAILTLVLGIGANTAIFTVTNALLLRPFPYFEPQQLVSVKVTDNDRESSTTLLRYEMIRDSSKSFQTVAVWANDNLNLTGSGQPLQIPVTRVSPGFFSMLGVQPTLGRIFNDGEGIPEAKPAIVLSNKLWHTRFQADPNIIGRSVNLDATPSTIVGVLPDVQFPFVGAAPGIWSPRYFEFSLIPAPRLRMGVGYLDVIARLRPEVSRTSADAELAMLNQRYREQNPTAPDANPTQGMTTVSLRDLVVGNVRGKVLVLTFAVGVVLLIACANVASLLLSRALARRREIAVRTALGASRGALISQLLTESTLLALVSGILGVGLSWIATRALVFWGASLLPQGIRIAIDLRVLAYTLVTSIAAGIAFGTVPALQLARADPNTALRDEGRGVSTGRNRSHLKNLLVVAQVALSLVLLVGAGLLLRSFMRLLDVDPGFDASHVLTMDVSLPTVKYSKPDQQIAFFDEVLRRIAVLPGVRTAGMSAALPLTSIRATPVLPEGQPDVPLAQRPFVDIEAISPKWFETMKVPFRSGRTFTDADGAQAPKVVIVNETFAGEFWPNESPVGKHVVVGRWPAPAEVIGVASDVKNKGLEQPTQPQLYLAVPQLPWGNMNLLVRTSVAPESLIGSVRSQIASIDPDQPLTNIQTVDELVSSSRSQPRFITILLAAFSATALTLTIVGIYGVLAYSVSQRLQEFGIRLALGAARGDIMGMVLKQGLLLSGIGIAIGLAAAFALTRLMSSMLFGIGPLDLRTFALAPMVFLAVALFASYLPARRATKVSAVEALR